MNKYLKRGIVSVLIVAIFVSGAVYKYITKADNLVSNDTSSVKRDTSISVDSTGNLNIERTSKEEKSMGKEDTWTLLVYMVGSDLESYYGSATKDLKEMMYARINQTDIKNVNILVQTGGCDMWFYPDIESDKTQRFHVDSIGGPTLVEEFEQKNMGDPETLYDFLNWGVTNYPAEHMSVVFWNHGSGVSKGVCGDIKYGDDSLMLPELEYAFSKVSKDMTSKFEMIGFDTCLAGSLEYANALAPYSKYMVASADTEPGTGWDYEKVINKLLENPDSTGEELGKVICDSYYDSLIKTDKTAKPTMATYDLSKVDNVCKEMNNLSKYMYDKITTDKNSYGRFSNMQKAVERVAYGPDRENMDIGSLLYYFDVSMDYDYNTDQFNKYLDEFIIYKQISNVYANNKAVGLTIYYPSEKISICQLNVMRNAVFSPYYLKYIEYLTYCRLGGTAGKFQSIDWENSEYFYEDNFGFLKYYRAKETDDKTMKDILSQNYKYVSDGFIDRWINNYAGGSSSSSLSSQYYDPNSPYTHRSIKVVDEGSDYTATIENKDIEDVYTVYNSIFTYIGDTLVCLGEDNSAIFDKETGKIKANFNNEWWCLADGQLLTVYVEESLGEVIYSMPVLINDVEMTVKFIENKSDNGKVTYDLLGVWDATSNSNYAGRGYLPLEEGSIITPIYDVYNEETDEFETEYGEEYTVTGNIDFLLSDLSDEELKYGFAIEGINGETTYSELVQYVK